jgi:hypothetical protein
MKLKDKNYLAGLIVVLGSFILYHFSDYYFLLTLPFFIIGLILIFISKKKRKTKFIILSISGITWILIHFFLAPKKTILIPSYFEGQFRIVYEEQCGTQPNYEKGRQLLKIPDNGILILKTKFVSDAHNEYFLVNKNGSRQKINVVVQSTDKAIKLPTVMIPFTSSLGQSTPFVNYTKTPARQIIFSDFYLFNHDTIDKTEDNIYTYNFLLLTDSIVNNCK